MSAADDVPLRRQVLRIELDEGARDVWVDVCLLCGALVGDRDRHVGWHRLLHGPRRTKR